MEQRTELVRYLEDTWVLVIDQDIDGPNLLPLRMDREIPNMGCRRQPRADGVKTR